MKKIVKLSMFLLFLTSCGSADDKTSSCEEETTTTLENTNSIEAKTPEKRHFIVGNWRADAKDAGVEILISFDKNGTFSQNMAGQKQEGTWETIDENQIKINSENLKNGQTWKIIEKGSDEMKVVFSVKDGFSNQEILFKVN